MSLSYEKPVLIELSDVAEGTCATGHTALPGDYRCTNGSSPTNRRGRKRRCITGFDPSFGILAEGGSDDFEDL